MCVQQKDVLTEIYSYISSDPKPPDSNETECALKYLEACNLLFEKGFLSHNKVSSHDRQVLMNILKKDTSFSAVGLTKYTRKV
jgi:hypothetical protein